ncbi:hypothetical protein PS2_015878 [Malus domestica]
MHRPPNLESQTPNMTTFSKIEERTSKHAQPLLTFEKTLPTRLLAPKSKRHRPPHLESQTPNMITFSKIEETLLSESREPNPQHDCFLKNRRGIVSKSREPDPRLDCLFENRRGNTPPTARAGSPWIKLSVIFTRNISFPDTTDHFFKVL